MNGSKFDRLTRILASDVSRRGLLATAAGLAVTKSQASLAAQLTPSTCAAAGEVCTLIRGCCDALTCVTSAINTNYGVCVPGDGGTVSIGTTLISPFSEEVEQEVAALANGATTADTSTTSTTTDLEAEREARIAAKKARKDDRRADKRLRQDTHKDELQDRREDRRLDREQRRGPRLEVELVNPGGGSGSTETVRVRNRDDQSVLLTKIESILNPRINTGLNRTLAVGGSFNFYSGITGDINDADELLWSNTAVCSSDAGSGAGIRVYVGFSSNSENREYDLFCDQSSDSGGDANTRRKKRKRQAGRGGKGRNSRNKNG